ncbi:MAG: ATP-dependent Clp protease ATP-binding subunit [Myxococcales bacterium]
MGPRESEIVKLRRQAEELAKGRSERMSTAHLLAAIASETGGAAELLRERRLDIDLLLRAARVVTDEHADALGTALQRARDFASRSPTPEPGASHLLFALCQERSAVAHRAIVQCGTDIAKLRAAAMQLAMGLVVARRPSAAAPPASPVAARPAVARPAVARPAPEAKRTASPRTAPPAPRSETPDPPAARPSPPAPAKPKPRRAKSSVNDSLSRFALDPKTFPALGSIGKNLSLAAALGELDPVVGRNTTIELALDVLAKRHANSPCLVGAAGVGKTSVVRGIAQRLVASEGDGRILIEVEASTLLAGTGVRGALAERLAQIKNEVKASDGRIVVFFDEVHALFGNDAGDEASMELKLALSKGELACIGATTPEEYRRTIEADPALARRFTLIDVPELGPEEARAVVEQLAPVFEEHHGVHYHPDAIAASIPWSVRYIPDRSLPDKAIALLDLAGARAGRRGMTDVGRAEVAAVLSEQAAVPIERLLETDGDRMLRLEDELSLRIVGHKAALRRIATVLRRNASGFRSQRPIGSFLLLGSTGVGKTETAKAIASCLFDSMHATTRLDLSEYAESHAIARLVGAPPGYVGHDAGGQLTEAVRKRPYQVVLLDEVEKAHRDVLEAFLQVFDEGRLTDGRGRTVDFSNTVIVLTSNLGTDLVRPSSSRTRIGFDRKAQEMSAGAYEEAILGAVRGALPPELYNRFDEVLVFAPLERADVAEIARRMLLTLAADLEKTRGIRLEVRPAAIEALLDAGGFDPELGARPMRRAIGRLVEAPVAEMVLRGELTRGDLARVDARPGVTVSRVTASGRPPSPRPPAVPSEPVKRTRAG